MSPGSLPFLPLTSGVRQNCLVCRPSSLSLPLELVLTQYWFQKDVTDVYDVRRFVTWSGPVSACPLNLVRRTCCSTFSFRKWRVIGDITHSRCAPSRLSHITAIHPCRGPRSLCYLLVPFGRADTSALARMGALLGLAQQQGL